MSLSSLWNCRTIIGISGCLSGTNWEAIYTKDEQTYLGWGQWGYKIKLALHMVNGRAAQKKVTKKFLGTRPPLESTTYPARVSNRKSMYSMYQTSSKQNKNTIWKCERMFNHVQYLKNDRISRKRECCFSNGSPGTINVTNKGKGVLK